MPDPFELAVIINNKSIMFILNGKKFKNMGYPLSRYPFDQEFFTDTIDQLKSTHIIRHKCKLGKTAFAVKAILNGGEKRIG